MEQQERGPREYRTAELAEAAGITVRTLRFYRERRLLPPPRKEGRVAWYDEEHLARLRTITALLERGHTLGGIAELISAFNSGRDADGTAELLGLTERYPWAEEDRVRLSPEALAEYYDGRFSADDLAAALEIGYLAVDGAELVHDSRALLEASSQLVRGGIPLGAVLDAGRQVREHADDLARLFTALVRTHVLPEILSRAAHGPLSEEEVTRLTEALEHLRPLAKQVVHAEVSLAVDRRLREELEQRTADPGSR
ncbi:MerR family transcriptional regulator [Streptomyces sp. ACA25]|uniref:MerR family transcriptional regulator n=1 Tax=Streptomyces sp. ACA25 TaxID=3022596 RepID=UPI00230701B5|nr:MerR family transcriptional regulator [Streptomyces sp. ACA25]MDB1087286.1 MerR family transcriptional regulator [Streptomyces sp. ACA25]